MTQERHGRNIARTIRFQQVTHTSFRSGCQENAMLFTACAIWMWCRWAKKKHEKKKHILWTCIATTKPPGLDEMNGNLSSHAAMMARAYLLRSFLGKFSVKWDSERSVQYRTIILLRLTKTDPNKWRMVYWYWLLIWIWCSYIHIDIVNIIYIYATNVEPIVLMLVLASSGICLYESNVIEIKCEIHKDITNQASLISLAWCWDGSGWNKIPLGCRP